MSRFKLKRLLKRVIISVVLALCCAVGLFGGSDTYVSAFITSDTTSYVSVGELWDSTNKTVNVDNVSILYKYLTGNADAKFDDVSTLASTTGSFTPKSGYTVTGMPATTASVIRAKTIDAGTEGDTSYTAKSNGQDIVVTFGGLTWTPTYLSTDKNGNSILTLWLSTTQQSAWSSRAKNEGVEYGFYNGGLYTQYEKGGYYSTTFNVAYPASLYATSYIRSVCLNAGGSYGTSSSAANTATQSSSNVFAKFTMSDVEGSLTDFLVTPADVKWQEFQSAEVYTESSYSSSNEAWGAVVDEGTDDYGNLYNFATSSSYGNSNCAVNSNTSSKHALWKDDYIWIPSVTETGYSTTYTGMWQLSTAQRATYTSASGTISAASIGTQSNTPYTGTISRSICMNSGSKAPYQVWLIAAAGTSRGSFTTYSCGAVRPALHLNLSAINELMPSDPVVGELWDSEGSTINQDNTKILLKYITGKSSATFGDVANLAQYTYSAADMRSTAVEEGVEGVTAYTEKKADQDIKVILGGLEWHVTYLSEDMDGNPILTLWLSNSTQDAWVDRSSTEGAYYGFLNGGLYSDWSANYYDYYFNATFPSSLYGTSYIRAVTLNNGGVYSTSATGATTYTKSDSSVFAQFTKPNSSETDLTDFLVTPSKVMWQKYQSAYNENTGQAFSNANDAWGSDVSNSLTNDPYSSVYNFNNSSSYGGISNYAEQTAKAYNDDWINDFLWLPSVAEVAGSGTGLWEVSYSQKATFDSNNRELLGSVGSTSGDAYAWTWLRSGFYYSAWHAYKIAPSGNELSGHYVEISNAVRPALHLNLAAVMGEMDYVEVDELWDDTNSEMNQDNIDILMKYITGNNHATYADIVNLADDTYAATQMRATTILSSGTSGLSKYSAKNSGQDIVVTLGGLKWHVTYLSKDMDGNPILTLWLSNSTQDAWKDRGATEGEYYGFIDGGLYSDWSANYIDLYFNQTYPSGMYGASYMRAVTLNNGGNYATSISTLEENFEQSEDNVFAKFTMPDVEGSLTDFLVTPAKVLWQKYQSAKTYTGFSYSVANDAWGDEVSTLFRDTYGNVYNFYVETTNGYGESHYAATSNNSNSYNNAWIYDYLWLPSITETGRSATYTGMWGLSATQRDNYDGNTNTTLGNYAADGGAIYARVWLRSGYSSNARSCVTLNTDGVSYSNGYVNSACAVRPALHLNLGAIMDDADFVEVGEIWNLNTKQINEDNVNILMKYITGSEDNDLDSVSTLAASPRTAAQMRSVAVTAGTQGSTDYIAKNNGQDIVVTLGGLKWHVTYLSKDMDGNPILTLWLSNSTQDAFNGRSSTEGEYYGFVDSGLYSDWSANYNATSFAENYPSSLYGASYIRAVTLNNGGIYATSTEATEEAEQCEDSVFANFTISKDDEIDITDFLVTPSRVLWQKYQSAYTSAGYRNSLPNDAWGSDVSNSLINDPFGNIYDFYVNNIEGDGNSNYAEQPLVTDYNGAWQDDYLWLPSLAETGYGDSNLGMWGVSISQRSNNDYGVVDGQNKPVGKITSGKANLVSWLRSGFYWNANAASALEKLGSGFDGYVCYMSAAVRPALHLNLSQLLFAPDDLSDGNGEISVDESSSVYDGNVKSPVVTVKYDGTTLTFNTDYLLSYTLNGETVTEIKNIGVYTITATGIGNYEGTLTINYEVTARDISTLTFGEIEDQIYTGFQLTPEFDITYELSLVEGADYTITYSNNINVGEATITLTGQGNFTGTASTTFNILQRVIDESVIIYAADKMLPDSELTISMGYLGKALIKSTDYSLSYSNKTDYGDCIVTITGIGNWTGSFTRKIEVADLYKVEEIDMLIPIIDVVYDGESSYPEVSLQYQNTTLVSGVDYQLVLCRNGSVTTDFTSSGAIEIHIIGKGNYTGERIWSYRVIARDISTVTVSVAGIEAYQVSAMGVADVSTEVVCLGDYAYTGSAIMPEIHLNYRDMTLISGQDFDVQYADNIEPGLATLTISGIGNYSGVRTITYNIVKAIPEVICSNTTEVYYAGQLTKDALLLSTDIEGEFVVEDDLLEVGTKSYNWTFIPNDLSRYSEISGTTKLTAIKDYVDRIEVNTRKSQYSVYSNIAKSDIIAVKVYASGMCEELGENDYYIDLGTDRQLTIDDVVKIKLPGETVYGVCDLDIKPLQISLSFGNYTGLLANGKKQQISVTISGEIDPNIEPELQVVYTNTRLGEYSDSIRKYGGYIVEVYSLNPNYEIVGDRQVEFYVEFASIPAWILAIVTFITVSGTVAIIGTIIHFKNKKKNRLTD